MNTGGTTRTVLRGALPDNVQPGRGAFVVRPFRYLSVMTSFLEEGCITF